MKVHYLLMLSVLSCGSPASPADDGGAADAEAACPQCENEARFSIIQGDGTCQCSTAPMECMNQTTCTCYAQYAADALTSYCGAGSNYCFVPVHAVRMLPEFHCMQ
jgi:hypothetical protein